jgi:uncharacterized protein YndB with AHSA1/START domain
MERSGDAVRQATGRGWEEWRLLLDAAGASALDHRAIIGLLALHHPELSSWWRQWITTEYRRVHGLRQVGETAAAGFQIGVRATVPASADAVWRLLAHRPELWLGDGSGVRLEPGAPYRVGAGPGGPPASGTIRVAVPGDRVRLSWHPDDWAGPATVQIRLLRSPAGTTVAAHVERLPDAATRQVLREHWRRTLSRVAAALEASDGG